MKKLLLSIIILFLSSCNSIKTPYYTINMPFIDFNIEASIKEDNGRIISTKYKKIPNKPYSDYEKYLLIEYEKCNNCSTYAPQMWKIKKEINCPNCRTFALYEDKDAKLGGYMIIKNNIKTYIAYLDKNQNNIQPVLDNLLQDIIGGK